MRVFLSGPMEGKPNRNVEAFADARTRLIERGHSVISPPHDVDQALGYTAALDRCLAYIRDDVDVVAMMRESEDSKGSTAEIAYSRAIGRPIYVEWTDGAFARIMSDSEFGSGKGREIL